MKICIISSKHVSYNPRVVKEADALTAAGHDVTVVTVCNNSEQAILDEGVMASRSWRLKTVNYRRLGVTERFRWLRLSLRQKLFKKLLNPLTHRLGIAERAQGREFPELKKMACSVKADLYIAHHAEALGAAYAAAKKHDARFAFDAEDFHSGMFDAPSVQVSAGTLREEVSQLLTAVERAPKCPEQQRIEYLEQKYLPHCDYITAASGGIAEAYAIKYSLPCPTTILNVFPLEPREAIMNYELRIMDSTSSSQFNIGKTPHSPFTFHPSQPLSPQSKIQNSTLRIDTVSHSTFNIQLSTLPKLYWYSQVIGPGRGLEDAVKALALLTLPCELHIRGTAQPAFVEELAVQATRLGIQGRLFLHPPCPPDELITEAARYDIGLALETGKELNNLLAVSNKIFTYMNAGLAVIATDTPSQRWIMAQVPDVGALCRMNDAESLAAAIGSLLSDPERLQAARYASRRGAEERSNWEMESRKLLSLVAGS